MPETINIAILGAGIWSREQFLPAIIANPTLNLSAVYSRSRRSCESLIASQSSLSPTSMKIYTEEEGSAPWTEILTDPSIHGIIIALPIVQQPAYVKKCLEAGKHVISEKPLADTTANATELIKFYDSLPTQNKGLWGCTEDYRYYASFHEAKRQIDERLGGHNAITTFSVRMDAYIDKENKYFQTPWRKEPDYMGGFILDGGVHYTSGLRLLLGDENPPVKVVSFANLKEEHLPPVDTLNGIIVLKNGVSGTFSVGFSTGGNAREMIVQTGKGQVRVTRDTVDIRERDGKEILKMHDMESAPGMEVDAFAESIRSGKMDPKMDVREAWRDLVLLECLLESAKQGGKVIDVPQDI